MFTGIVVEMGTVRRPPPRLRIAAPGLAREAAVGDSIAIEGCCLTVVLVAGDELAFDAVPETLRLTTLGGLEPGDRVNLEPALRAGDRMAGHWVQGHVDGVGAVVSTAVDGDAVEVTFSAPPEVLATTILKGSVTVAGVSLTVTAVDDDGFSVTLVPHTRQVTTLGNLEPGRRVNLEADVLGRYVQHLLARSRLPL
ncbi:MAG TPA: riboflavin synthase [Gaiellales bacterium]|nr:riboflavin synthase [Gaiellales bacterium]